MMQSTLLILAVYRTRHIHFVMGIALHRVSKAWW